MNAQRLTAQCTPVAPDCADSHVQDMLLCNKGEADIVAALVRNALRAGTPASSIAVLASNVLQLQLICDAAAPHREPLPNGVRFAYEDSARHLVEVYMGMEEARKAWLSQLVQGGLILACWFLSWLVAVTLPGVMPMGRAWEPASISLHGRPSAVGSCRACSVAMCTGQAWLRRVAGKAQD